MIVLALVTTDGGSFLVGDAAADEADDENAASLIEPELLSELESELELWLATLFFNPVSWTAQELGPPPMIQSGKQKKICLCWDLHVSKLYPLHFELHSESDTLLSDAGSRSPHQQLDPMVVPITGLSWETHCCWQYPGDWYI